MTGRDSHYDLFKKKKSPKLKKVRHLSEFFALKALHGFAGIGSVKAAQSKGARMGRLAYRLAKRDRGVAEYQLGFCFPQMKEEEKEELVKKMFENFGKTLFEALVVDKIREESHTWIRFHNEEVIKEVFSRGKGGVVLCGHFGNWELFTVIFEMLGIQGFAIESPIGVDKLDQFLLNIRKSDYLQMIPRGDKSSAKSILRCLKNNQFLLSLVDQDTRVQSLFVDFFGKKAATPRGPASIAQKFDLPVVSAFGARNKDGVHDFYFELLTEGPYSEGEEEIARLTQVFADATESHIRRFPDQWAWFHRRWKTRPH